MSPTNTVQDLTEALNKAQGQLEAAELELHRVHRFLDEWGLPRELADDHTGHVTELSLIGRLELIAEDAEDDEEED
ncbi:MAG: hypothetical protein GY930_17365 [bacterium]|nr:hypothetical protein [bacterium]